MSYQKQSSFYGLSAHQKRDAKMHLSDYNRMERKPQRGIITYGGGVNIEALRVEAEKEGFFTSLTPQGLVLR